LAEFEDAVEAWDESTAAAAALRSFHADDVDEQPTVDE
jgi:hypothetical protein